MDSGSFANTAKLMQSKSILKSKGDKTKSIGLEFDQIDEDSSEEKGVDSCYEDQGKNKIS
jgi:hypothetical protein